MDVYILELRDNHWYVGSTTQLDHRIAAHFAGNGSEWTKAHPPIRVVEAVHGLTREDAKRVEREKVVALAQRYGADRVRGGGFTRTANAKVRPERSTGRARGASAARRGRRRRLMEEHPDVIREQGIQRANGEVTPINAGDVLAKVIDELRLARLPLSSQAKGILAKQIKGLLADGFDWQIVGHAAVLAVKRGTPHHAHFIAGDLAAASAGVWLSTREEYRRAVQDEVEIAKAMRLFEERS